MTENTDNKERKIVNMLGKEGVNIDKKGKDAYIFVHLEGLQDFDEKCDENTIKRWYNGVRDTVWSSLTAAGQPIRFAYFCFFLPNWLLGNYSGESAEYDQWELAECKEEMESFAKGLPKNEQIVIALASDVGTPQYYAEVEKQTNIIAPHRLHYTRAAPRDMKVVPEEKELEYIFSHRPREWCYEVFNPKKPSLKIRKLERKAREDFEKYLETRPCGWGAGGEDKSDYAKRQRAREQAAKMQTD